MHSAGLMPTPLQAAATTTQSRCGISPLQLVNKHYKDTQTPYSHSAGLMPTPLQAAAPTRQSRSGVATNGKKIRIPTGLIDTLLPRAVWVGCQLALLIDLVAWQKSSSKIEVALLMRPIECSEAVLFVLPEWKRTVSLCFQIFCRSWSWGQLRPCWFGRWKITKAEHGSVSQQESHLDHAVSSKTSHKNNVPPNALRTRPYWGSKKIEKQKWRPNKNWMSFSKLRD